MSIKITTGGQPVVKKNTNFNYTELEINITYKNVYTYH